jgi:hypothetical protein
VRRAIVIAIAIGTASFFALVFWQVGMNATDAAAGVLTEPEYAIPCNPYLPIEWLRPAW